MYPHPGLCTYLCMMLSTPFFHVFCCQYVSTICVVRHLQPSLFRIMCWPLDSGCAVQSCVQDLHGRAPVLGPQFAVLACPLMSWGTAGKMRVCHSPPLLKMGQGSRKLQSWICAGTGTHECLCLCESGCENEEMVALEANRI